MKRPSKVAVQMIGLVCGVGLLSGCANVKDAMGLAKSPPDEFAVVKKAPLVMPPDYALRPPEPGAPRPQELQPTESARLALLGDSGVEAAEKTQGEELLLQSADADRADPSIRVVLNDENGKIRVKSQAFADQVIFYEPVGQSASAPVTNVSTQALGLPGDDVPAASTEIGQEEKKGGIWSKITGVF